MSAELGSTSDPVALIPGDPAAVRADAAVLTTRSTELDEAADALADVRTPGWEGSAADAYTGVMDRQPRSWRRTADALTSAATELTAFADALAAAQSRASDAVALWDEALDETATATADHNRRVTAYNTALRASRTSGRPTIVPYPPGPFHDPSVGKRAEAQAILSDARDAVRRAGDDAVHVLTGIVVSDDAVISTESGTQIGKTEVDHPDPLITIGSDGTVKIGLVSVDGSISWFSAAAGTEARYGSWFAKAEAEVEFLKAEASAGAGWKDGDLFAEASAGAYLVDARASASAGGRYVTAEAEARATVGAYAEAGVTIGTDGVGANIEAFVGGKAEVSGSVEVAGVGVGATADVRYGVGVEADAGVKKNDDGSWTFELSAGASIGLGAGFDTEFTVDPKAVTDAIGDAADWIGSLF
jgi:uncharacterized protein YukE